MNTNIQKYESIFSFQELKNFLKFISIKHNDFHIINTPFYIYQLAHVKHYQNIKHLGNLPKQNELFGKQLKEHVNKNIKKIGFVVIICIDPSNYHMISCILQDGNYLQMYDSNGPNFTPLQENMDGNPIGPNSLNINYLIVIYYIQNLLLKSKINVYVQDKIELVPNFCFMDNYGICGFWSFLYILFHMYGNTHDQACYLIHQIAFKLSSNKSLFFRLIKPLNQSNNLFRIVRTQKQYNERMNERIQKIQNMYNFIIQILNN